MAFKGHCPLFRISTINSTATVKNQSINRLKTRLKHQMGCKLMDFLGNRSKSYICYLHKGGN